MDEMVPFARGPEEHQRFSEERLTPSKSAHKSGHAETATDAKFHAVILTVKLATLRARIGAAHSRGALGCDHHGKKHDQDIAPEP